MHHFFVNSLKFFETSRISLVKKRIHACADARVTPKIAKNRHDGYSACSQDSGFRILGFGIDSFFLFLPWSLFSRASEKNSILVSLFVVLGAERATLELIDLQEEEVQC